MWYIFLKEDCSRMLKIIFPCAERTNTKTKYTNIQIQHMTKCQRGIKNCIPIQYKLDHLSFAQLYEVQFKKPQHSTVKNVKYSIPSSLKESYNNEFSGDRTFSPNNWRYSHKRCRPQYILRSYSAKPKLN